MLRLPAGPAPADGFLLGANYTYARKFENTPAASRLSLATDRIYLDETDVPHSFKMNWFYELPFGRGRKYAANVNRALDLLLGGWDFSGTGRVQTQQYQANGIRLVGMTKDELQDAFKIRKVVDPITGTTTVFSLPQDIIDNTRKAFNTDPTSANHYGGDGVPTGRHIAPGSTLDCLAVYLGDCGTDERITLNGPLFTRFDLSVKKRFTITSRINAELGVDIYNAFNNINFNHQFNPGGGVDVFRVTTQFTDINTTFDPGGRLAQLSWRINW
ncbi:MAG: hypothetical protein M3R55_16035 [Acidobacteriota bacterium]|nr:hypothetical protein [Acidobacteriota bacterium]